MDVQMPRRGGIEACSAIKTAAPSTKILMLTMSDDEGDLYEAIRSGASGYLLKDLPGRRGGLLDPGGADRAVADQPGARREAADRVRGAGEAGRVAAGGGRPRA
jgi:DNA-binding NtrC family response regulator